MEIIKVEHGLRKELIELLGCTYPTIKSALEYRTNTALSSKIRQAALNRGGKKLSNNQ
jgi:hypothetical protein